MISYWYRTKLHPLSLTLLPIAGLFFLISASRRLLYRFGILPTKKLSVPVIVVGNITVGGTGKTPFVIWLANFLRQQGYQPGIISRGVGGKKHKRPHWVKKSHAPKEVGDEAKLLIQHANCEVVICVNRVAAATDLLQKAACNVIISDDGLQHYRLGRDIEIVMVDGLRRFGNQCLLPAGPLREPISRLQQVDFVIVNEGDENEELMQLKPKQLISLDRQEVIDIHLFPHRTIHAVAGIGNPERFFSVLKKAGFNIMSHIFPDHYLFKPEDLEFNDKIPIIRRNQRHSDESLSV